MQRRTGFHPFFLFVWLVWLTIGMHGIRAQNSPSFKFVHYNDKQGLNASEILSMAEDDRGFLWLAATNGVSSFDGKTFRHYSMPAVDSNLLSSSNNIEQLQCYGKEVWCLNEIGHFYRLDRTTDTFVFTGLDIPGADTWEKKRPDYFVQFVADTTRHCLWGKGPEGLFRFDLNTGVRKSILPFPDVAGGEIELDQQGKLWCSAEQGILFFDPDTGEKRRFFESIQFLEMRCQSDGKIWAASSVDTFYYIDTRSKITGWVKTNADYFFKGMKPDCANSILFVPGITGDSVLWLATCGNGIVLLDIGTGQFIDQFDTESYSNHRLLHDWINLLLLTKDQTLWVASHKGIAKADRRQFSIHTRQIPFLKTNQIARVRQVLARYGHPEQKWIVTGDLLLLMEMPSQRIIQSYAISDEGENRWGKINNMQYDEEGNLWLAVSTGLVRIDQALHAATFKIGIPGALELIVEDRNSIWVRYFTDAGLFHPASKTYAPVVFPKNSRDDGQPTYKISKGLDQSVLICSDSAVWRVRSADYDPSCNCFPHPESVIKTIQPGDVVETDTSFWVFNTVGLAEYHKTTGRIRRFGAAEGLTNLRVRSMLQGPHGQLWMNSDNGIFVFYPKHGRFKRYSEEDGLAENFVPGILTRDGAVLHAGFSYAYSTWNPGGDLVQTNVKPCITDVFALDDRLPVNFFSSETPAVTVRHAQNILRFEFTCPDFYQSENITFRYQLDGFDPAPRNAGTARSAAYTNLDGGHYTFRVWAVNADGFLCETPAVLALRVIPPYYRTWWFYTLCVAAIGGIFYAIFRYREIQRVRQYELRQRIARDLHDEVGSTLSAISILSQSAGKGAAVESNQSLDNIGDKARAALDSMSDIVWAVNPQNDAMDQVIGRMAGFAAEMLEGAGILPHFSIGEGVEKLSLPLGKRKHFYLIFKEAIANCARHSKAEHAYISLKKEEGNLVFELSDDGVGLPDNAPGFSSGGNGLKNMAARARTMGALFRVGKKTDSGGTVLMLIIPL